MYEKPTYAKPRPAGDDDTQDPNAGRRSAVALSYKDGQHSPRVVAKGYGMMAERIIERAKESGVFVHDSPELVSLLMQVDLDKHIPPELYRAVAEVLAFVYFLEHQAGAVSQAAPALGAEMPVSETLPEDDPLKRP